MKFQKRLYQDKQLAVLLVYIGWLTIVTTNGAVIIPPAELHSGFELEHGVKTTAVCDTKIYNCSKTFPAAKVVLLSYNAHVVYIRRGVAMDVVDQFFNNALVQMLKKCCVCENARIEEQCVNNHFIPQTDDASLDLWWLVADDEAKTRDFDKAFPNLQSNKLLPELDEISSLTVAEHRKKTMQMFVNAARSVYEGKLADPEAKEFQGHIVSLPSDDELLYDPKQDEACKQFKQLVTTYTVSVSATALTSYVLGLVHQLAIISSTSGIEAGSSTLVEIDKIMQDHVNLVYTASRCVHTSGSSLLLPTVLVHKLVHQVSHALRMAAVNSKMSTTILQGLPEITSVALLAHVARQFFQHIVDRLSSVGSGGTAKLVTWTGNAVLVEDVTEIILRNSTVDEVELFANDLEIRKEAKMDSCGGNFVWVDRIDHVNDWREQCCWQSCVTPDNHAVTIALINEMCCMACNLLSCDFFEVAHVHLVLKHFVEAHEDNPIQI